MENIKLSARLSAIAAFAEGSECLADVGCDHGYLPVWLIINGLISSAVASDINRKPLEKAVKCAAEHGVEDKMTFFQANGLDGIELGKIDAVAIAGMGGENIEDIISRAPKLRDGAKKLILQPMTKVEELVGWLYDNGFYIEDERLAEDAGEIYRVMLARFGAGEKPGTAETYAGESLFKNRDPLLVEYIQKICDKLGKALEGMLSSSNTDTLKKAEEQKRLLAELQRMKGRCSEW